MANITAGTLKCMQLKCTGARRSMKKNAAALKPMALYYIKPYVALGMLLNVSCAIYVGFMVIAAGVAVITLPVAFIMLLFVAPFFIGIFLGQMKSLLWQGPVLVIDDTGITDLRERHSFVPWSDIEKIYLSRRRGPLVLCVNFRNADTIRRQLTRPFLLKLLFSKANFEGDWNLKLGALRCKHKEVLRVAKGYHSRSTREKFRKAIGLNTAG